MNSDIQDPWRRFLEAAARPDPATQALSRPPPTAFLDALRHQRAALWKIARALLWRKWSLLLALAAFLVYLGTLIFLDSMESPAPAIPRPATPSLQQP